MKKILIILMFFYSFAFSLEKTYNGEIFDGYITSRSARQSCYSFGVDSVISYTPSVNLIIVTSITYTGSCGGDGTRLTNYTQFEGGYIGESCTEEKPDYFVDGWVQIPIDVGGTAQDKADFCNAQAPNYAQVEFMSYDVCDVHYDECRGLPLECQSGYIKNDNGDCCDALGRDTSYAVSKEECGAEEIVQIDNLTIANNFIWNECLNLCTCKTLPPCPKGKVYDSNGYCVSPMLDDNDCSSAGGNLAPYYFRPAQDENEIINYNVAEDLDHSKCHNIAICKADDGSNLKDENGNTIYSSEIVSCGTDNNEASDDEDNNITDNKCSNCPSQYPIATDAGSCANSNGETTYCPTSQEGETDAQNDSNLSTQNDNNDGNTDDNTNNITCGTCSLLGGAISTGSWSASAWVAGDNGMCKRTTINGITQISSCPTSPQNDNNISITPGDGNATLKAGETDTTCPCCPEGTKSTASGKCLKILSSGSITMMVPCPCDTEETPRDGNSTEPLDNNGTDDNATGLQNEFGKDLEREMKKAYKSYTIFNTSNCGELSIQENAYIGDPEATISDPLPLFRDVIQPYRNIIKNFLMFMAIIIGLFDFFKRS